jgi:DNA-binding NarL/FixJ family response regulator
MNERVSERIRILVADDHPIVRDGLIAVLSTQSDFAVVGEAATGAEAIERALALAPDVILLDLAMSGGDGVEALLGLRERHSDARAIIFTAFDTDERILAAVRAGAQGYLLKGTPREEIFQAIRTVHAGGSLLTPIVASRLLRHLGGGADASESSLTLTRREDEVLRLLARGLQNKEIAAQMGISERTVKFHVAAVLRKLDAGNRTEAVTLAVQRGLLHLA